MTETILAFATPAVVRNARRAPIEVEPLTCAIGAELHGVNLGDAARDPDLFAEIKALLLKHKVLFLSDQDITRAEHVGFARRFGPLEDHPVVGSDPENPGLVVIRKGPDSRAEQYENAWHCDTTWRECPQLGAVLRCTEAPAVGGDMLWANMTLAYERLPEHVKAQIADLRARHSIEATFGAAMPIEKRLALKAQFPDAEHPVVRTHPETGEKALFVNAFTTHFTNFHTPANVRFGQDYRARRQPAPQLPDQPGLRPRVPGAPAAAGRTPSRSGTTAAPSTTPSRTSGRPCAPSSAPASSATARSEKLRPPPSTGGGTGRAGAGYHAPSTPRSAMMEETR